MRFPYRQVPGEVPGEIEYEPYLVVRAIGPPGGGDRLFPGIIDTGSPYTLLPFRDLERMKVQIRETRRVGVANGTALTVRFGILELELRSTTRRTAYRWPAWVGFAGIERALWGHMGFLDHFTATFNGRLRHVTLQPNGTFSTAAAGRAST